MTDVRPVWLTREERDALWSLDPQHGGLCDRIAKAWLTAPADSVEAIRLALVDLRGNHDVFWRGPEAVCAEHAVKALGMPE